MKQTVLVALLLLISACSNPVGDNKVMCEEPSISIAEQDFSWPLSSLQSINVLNTHSAAIEIKFLDNKRSDIAMITLTESQVTGGLSEGGYEKFDVKDLTSFFTLLADGTQHSKKLEALRRVMSIKNSGDLTITKKEWGYIYTSLNSENGHDAVYLKRNGDDRIVMLVTDLIGDDVSYLEAFICP